MQLATFDGRAFGGSLRIVVTSPDRLGAAREAVQTLVAAIDLAASRFREDSELSRINAGPGRVVTVSPLLARFLEAALRGARLTEGAVDPTVGTAIRLVGYDKDFAGVAPTGTATPLSVARVPGWQAIEFEERGRLLRVPRGVEIDLGATAKALASDLTASTALEAMGSGGVLISLGGDIAVAGTAPAEGWPVQVSEDSGAPIESGEETISIRSGGIATSSTTVRRWSRGGVALHHIIDPATGLPAAGPWRTVTVVAQSCLDANIASTAAIVRGDDAIAWFERHQLPALLVDHSGKRTRVAGWPEPAG